MASKVRQSTRDLARHITRAVYESTDGQLRRWRMLSTIPGATAAAVLYAEEQGWLELEGAHSACLTEEGRRLIAKEAN
jgi:hypothetical protein